MTSITAQFDGKVFVPAAPVNLPAGTRVEVVIPSRIRRPTEQDDREWREVLDDLAATSPEFPTVEDALKPTRRRP